MLVFCTILCSTSAMAGTSHPSCCHTRSLWRVSIFFPSYPRFQAGIHSKGNQDGFPINNVGNDGEREILASVFALVRRSATARKREDKIIGIHWKSAKYMLELSGSPSSRLRVNAGTGSTGTTEGNSSILRTQHVHHSSDTVCEAKSRFFHKVFFA